VDILIAGHREGRGTYLAFMHRFLRASLCFWCFYLTRALGRRSLRACFLCVQTDLLRKARRRAAAAAPRRLRRAAEPRRPSPPPLPPPHTRALGWAAVTTSRGRYPRRRGSCQEKREDGAVLLIAAELRQTPKLSGGRSSMDFVEAQEDAHFSNIKYYSERGLGPYIYNKAKSLPTPLALIK
jgi:hypothetical protein